MAEITWDNRNENARLKPFRLTAATCATAKPIGEINRAFLNFRSLRRKTQRRRSMSLAPFFTVACFGDDVKHLT